MRNFAGAANKFLEKFYLGWSCKETSKKQTDCRDWIIVDNQKKKGMTDSTLYHTIFRNAVADTSGHTLKWLRVNLAK